MEEKPLYKELRLDSLNATLNFFSGLEGHHFHMPGHKGQLPGPFKGVAKLDVTELDLTGNLYSDDDNIIHEAERNCAKLYDVPGALYLTGGSTQGIFTMLATYTSPGDRIAVDRCCHRSVFHAMALLDLIPYYLTRQRLLPMDICLPLKPQEIPRDCTCAIVTSPTYYGILSQAEFPVPILLDAAHGAHLPFLPGGKNLLSFASMAVCSAHKTLPALGQAAFLLLSDPSLLERARYFSSVIGTSSPSYPIMASMELAFEKLQKTGTRRWGECAKECQEQRKKFPNILRASRAYSIDPTRLCVYTGNGYADAMYFEDKFSVWVEMADENNMVLIRTPEDSSVSLHALNLALKSVKRPLTLETIEAHSLPERVLSPRQAMFAPRFAIELTHSAGKIATQPLAPYPPGVPLVAPGERIRQEDIDLLENLWYTDVEPTIFVQVAQE